MINRARYRSEKKDISFGSKMITLENLTPILSPNESEQRRQEIEKRLYDVFSKYSDVRNK